MRQKNRKHLIVIAAIFVINGSAFYAYGQDAKKLYDQTCSTCHGPNGKGDGPTGKVLQPKPADLSTALKGKEDTYISKAIHEGGASVGKSPLMPSYKGLLTDEQIRGLVQYVKGLSQ
ncbi:MAG: cytochrome c [Candidatus Binatia bacterium]